MYRRARSAMVRLGADTSFLEEYKALKEKDLRLNKDITEESRLFQRNDILPWFWIVSSDDQSDVTKEGK
jgi:hypothetical protein